MAFYKLEEALKVTGTDPLKGVLIKRQLLKNPLSDILQFADADRLIYTWLSKTGVGGSGKRELNGEFHRGQGGKTEIASVHLGVYNVIREIDRLVQEYNGDLLENGIFQQELVDASDSVNFDEVYDVFNASKAKGDAFDGLFALAAASGQVRTIADGGVAAELTAENVYDEMSRLQDETEGDDTEGVFILSRQAYTKLTKYLRLSGFDVTENKDNFGRAYTRFRDSLIVRAGSYTINSQDGTKVKRELIETKEFGGVEGTERIIYATFSPTNVHGVRGMKHPKVETNVKDLGPAEHPMIDVEDVMAIVDKANGSVSVLEGIILS